MSDGPDWIPDESDEQEHDDEEMDLNWIGVGDGEEEEADNAEADGENGGRQSADSQRGNEQQGTEPDAGRSVDRGQSPDSGDGLSWVGEADEQNDGESGFGDSGGFEKADVIEDADGFEKSDDGEGGTVPFEPEATQETDGDTSADGQQRESATEESATGESAAQREEGATTGDTAPSLFSDGPEIEDPTTPTVVSRGSGIGRWRVWLGGALTLTGLGLLYGSPLLLAAAVIPLAYVGFGALSALPESVTLAVERQFDARQITPGDPVEVALTVRNDGESVLTDVRVLDGVPEELAVVEGSPRASLSLRPGGEATLRYSVVAKRGEFQFEQPRVRIRSLAGTDAVSLSMPVDGEDELSCTSPATTVPLDRASPLRVGGATSATGGEGLEFHSTREYRHGDPQSRVNWRQFAKRGELVTTLFREERSGRAVVLLDVRPPTRRSATPAYPTGAEFAAYTAEVAVEHLSAAGTEVSLAVLGTSPDSVGTPVSTAGDAIWVGNADGGDGAERARTVLSAAAEAARQRVPRRDADAGYQGQPPAGTSEAAASLAARCPPKAHVVLVSPFADAAPLAYARRFAVEGNAVTVVAPDHTDDGTLGGRTEAIHRDLRLRTVKPLCSAVVDWPADQPLTLAVARALGPRSGGGGQ
jgi:uncharacterized repeat protein (TIGR01451 family)